MSAVRQPRCPYCLKVFPPSVLVSRHISSTPTCRKAWQKALTDPILSARYNTHLEDDGQATEPPGIPDEGEVITGINHFDNTSNLGDAVEENHHNHSPPAKRARLGFDQVEREAARDRYVESYPSPAGVPKRGWKVETKFKKARRDQKRYRLPPWDPFANIGEWQLAQWQLNNVGQKATDSFLNLPIVRTLGCPLDLFANSQ